MRICLDIRSPGHAGVLTYVNEFVDAILSLDKDNEYYLITDSGERRWSNAKYITLRQGSFAYWCYWSNVVLPKRIAEYNIDIYHSLKHVTAFRGGAKKLLTLHGAEMIYRFPQMYKAYDLWYWRFMYYLAGRFYQRLLTATRAEADFYGTLKSLARDKFRITPFAASGVFGNAGMQGASDAMRRKHGLPEKFLLFVGRYHPIKNLDNLLKAFAEAAHSIDDDYKLLLVGEASGPHYEDIVALADSLHLRNRVVFHGRVSEDLHEIYALADAFVFPSLYENFGFVLLEAMSAGLPVITSSVPVLDEVVGDAALRVNPRDPHQLAAAMVKLLSDPELRSDLAARSLGQSERFSWEACARKTLAAYQELGGRNSG